MSTSLSPAAADIGAQLYAASDINRPSASSSDAVTPHTKPTAAQLILDTVDDDGHFDIH
jgi:hypothetical protein